jgi:hypothetical protein
MPRILCIFMSTFLLAVNYPTKKPQSMLL